MADSFIETDAGRNRDIKAIHFPDHRNANKVVAVVSRDLAEAPAFAAQDETGGACEIDIIERFFPTVGSAHDLDVEFTEFAQEHVGIFYLKEGDFVSTTTGDITDGVG